MSDHRKRFDRWRRLAPKQTKYMIEQVLDRLIPVFAANGFVWYADYAAGDPDEIGANTIPLQIRSGLLWPTVEIRLPGTQAPCFSIYFSALPDPCRRFGLEPVPRERAIVIYAPAYFMLCKGRHRNLDGQFGYRYFSLRPASKIDREVATALELVPEIFRLFEEGIPSTWLTRQFGYVSKHIRLVGSWHHREQRRPNAP